VDKWPERALDTWRHRSWIFPRDPAFAAKAERLLELYAGRWDGVPLGPREYLAMFALYEVLRARVIIDNVQVVDGAVCVYTSGEVSGRLPFLGWVTLQLPL
jgi:hypothetical protein